MIIWCCELDIKVRKKTLEDHRNVKNKVKLVNPDITNVIRRTLSIY